MTVRGGATDPRIKDPAGQRPGGRTPAGRSRRAPRRLARAPSAEHRDAGGGLYSDTGAVESGRQVPLRHERLHQGHSLLQGPRQHRHPRGHVVEQHRARRWHRPPSQRDRRGLAAGVFATPVAVTAGTIYVASYHAPNGGYSAIHQPVPARQASTTACCMRSARLTAAATACSSYGARQRLPEFHLQRPPTTGWTWCSTPTARPAGHHRADGERSTSPTSDADLRTRRDAAEPRRHGLRQRRRDPGDLDQ